MCKELKIIFIKIKQLYNFKIKTENERLARFVRANKRILLNIIEDCKEFIIICSFQCTLEDLSKVQRNL